MMADNKNVLDWEKARKSAAGKPRTNYREIEKSSQEGLPENWTRATFIVREDLLQQLKQWAAYERKSIKDVVKDMMTEYLSDKEIPIERGETEK